MAGIRKIENKSGKISYQLIAYTGYDENGKQLTKTKVWKPEKGLTARQAKKEAIVEAEKFQKAVISGQYSDKKVTFSEYSNHWLNIKKATFAPITFAKYETLLIRINKALGHKRMDFITPNDLDLLYSNLREIKSEKTGKPLSPQTIKHYHSCIRAVFAFAQKKGIVTSNPAFRADAPTVDKKEPMHFDYAQARRFVEALQSEVDLRKQAAFTLLIYSGIRIGELCGLQWEDLDFDKCTIKIQRTSQFAKGQGIITKTPKNRTSSRTVKLPATVFDTLRSYRAWYNEQRLSLGDKWIESGRLFVQWNGKPITPSALNKWLDAIIQAHGLPRITPHGLRHTNISLLIANGVDIRTVANKAGHSRTSTTTDIYAHAIQAAEEAATEVLDTILTPKPNRNVNQCLANA